MATIHIPLRNLAGEPNAKPNQRAAGGILSEFTNRTPVNKITGKESFAKDDVESSGIVVNSFGLAKRYSSSNSLLGPRAHYFAPAEISAANDFTAVMVFTRCSAGTSFFAYGHTNYCLACWFVSDTVARFNWVDSALGDRNLDVTVSPFTGKDTYTIVFKKHGNTRTAFILNPVGATSYGTQTSGLASIRNETAVGFATSYFSLPAETEYSLLAVVGGALSDPECRDVLRNPWQLFRADPIRIYSLPSGPISLAINSLTASNITQTGARITLGLTR